jgi:glycerol kinase
MTRGLDFLPDGIPIAGLAGDQQAALFGQACFEPGDAKCTFGTGSFILVNTGERRSHSKNGLLSTVAWRLPGEKPIYALEGGAFVCGAAVQFLRDQLKLIKTSAEIEALARSVKDCGGVEFVPALTGLGAPHWDPVARGLICGLTRGTERGHIARATLEAMALQNAEILLAMQDDIAKPLRGIRVDGGASANALLMQMQADFLGVPVTRPKQTESTVAGAGYLAGLGVGLYRDLTQIKKLWRREREFKPKQSASGRRERLNRWSVAVRRARLSQEVQ